MYTIYSSQLETVLYSKNYLMKYSTSFHRFQQDEGLRRYFLLIEKKWVNHLAN
jgi:hypothetical protein